MAEAAAEAASMSGLISIISIIILGLLFLTDDYSVQYVWQYSNMDMPWFYKVTAVWGGMDGSMLLWAVLLGAGGFVLTGKSRKYPPAKKAWILAFFSSSVLFFLTVATFFTNPFANIQSDVIPPDGNGLNPLLQNAFMAIHPPIMYLGFTLFAVPFALCLGSVLSGDGPEEWVGLTRRWCVVAWIFLTGGIVLGAFWAYIELGWGGFWAWDPVENASFHPWLTATAFLHCAIVQEKRRILRMWNVWLIALTYGLTVFGTFLTRSGIVQSVHAFASTDIAWIFLVYLAGLFFVTLAVTIRCRKRLSPESPIESVFCLETLVFVGNLVLLSICFSIIWGVMFPVISEAISGQRQTVSAPFFNAVTVPQFFILLVLMGIAPLVGWKRASLDTLRRGALLPLAVSALLIAAMFRAGIRSPYPVAVFFVGMFILLVIAGDFIRRRRCVKGEHSSLQVAREFPWRRRGAHIVHSGVAICAVAIASAMGFKMEVDFSLQQGESREAGNVVFTLRELRGIRNPNYEAILAEVDLREKKGGESKGELVPESRYYISNRQPTSEVGLKVGLLQDVYLVLAGLDDEQKRATFKAFINPLQVWLWIGVVFMIIGAAVSIVPSAGSNGQSHGR